MKKHRIFLVLVLLAILFSFTVVNCKWLLVAENDTSNEKGFEPINQLEDIKNLEKISNEETKARQVLSLLFKKIKAFLVHNNFLYDKCVKSTI